MQYLTIISKAEFVDLFKYGHIYVRRVTTFEEEITELKDNLEKFNEVTVDINPFDYSFEYLMLHISSEKKISYNPEIELSDVLGIYVFNEEAKKKMSISFDNRIQIHVSDWSPLFDKLQETLSQKQSMRGIDNLWKIFELDEEDKKKCATIIDNQIISETFRELYAYERPSGDLSPWVYLLRYERHSLYPKKMKGFFCDFIHVFQNWMSQKELIGDVAESTALYHQLDKDKFFELVHIVEKSPLSRMCRDRIKGCNFYIAAPLYLYLKSISGDSLKWILIEKIVEYSKKKFGFDFSVATYLLGITLGYDGTYDCLYDRVGLSIFKAKVLPQEQESEDDFVSNASPKEGNDELREDNAGSKTNEESQQTIVEETDTNTDVKTENEPLTESVNVIIPSLAGDDIPEQDKALSNEPTEETTQGIALVDNKVNSTEEQNVSSDLFGNNDRVLMHNGKKGKNRVERYIPMEDIDKYKKQGWKKQENKINKI